MKLQPITPNLWFDGNAEEAANFYVSIFPNSRIVRKTKVPAALSKEIGAKPGSVLMVEFELNGQPFLGLNGGPAFKFNEAVSFMVHCKDQEEVDHYWEKLTAGGSEQPCGWAKDKFGLSWQIDPAEWMEMVTSNDEEKVVRGMKAMLQMKKMDLAKLKAAYNGTAK